MTIISRLLGRTQPDQRATTFQDWFGIDSAQLDYSGPAAAGSGGYAMANAAQWACVGLKGDQIGTMPIKAYRSDRTGNSLELPDQPMLLTNPSEYLTPAEWMFALVAGLMLHGNAVGVVTRRTREGWPGKVEWLDPGLVSITQGDGYAVTYRVGSVEFAQRDVVHVRGVTLPGQVRGLSPVEVLRKAFEAGTHAQEFAHGFFKNGGHPSGVLSSDQIVTKEQAEAVKAKWLATLKAGQPAVLGNGLTYSPITVNPKDSQFLESQQFSATQIARIHRIPPEMIGADSGSTMTYSNVEAQSLHFLTYSIRPDLARIEQVLTRALPGPQFVKFNAGAMLRTDLKTRYESYVMGLSAGFLTVEQIWAWEDWGPVPAGLSMTQAIAQLEGAA